MTDSKRHRIGVDLLTVTPPDALNRKYLAVFVVHGSKLVSLHPLQDPSALEVARACYTVFARYGVVQDLASDAGREFMNDLLKQLTTWFGVTKKFALVERHESNGVEHTNQPIIRHLQALVCDNECLKTEWSSPENLSMVEFLLNSSVNSETGFSAFELHFGSEELTHFHLPTGLPSASQNPSEYLKKLNTNLEHLWSLSQKHHASVQAKRKAITKEELNQYSPGDLVLMRREDPKNRDKKLDTPYLGPYLVKSHEGNTVQIQHLASHLVSSRHVVERFKPFWGTLAQGTQLARTDLDHFVVLEILAYRNDIDTRTSLDFLLRYVSVPEFERYTHIQNIYEKCTR